MALRRSATARTALLLAASVLAAACSNGGGATTGEAGPAARNATRAALLPTHVAALPTLDTGAFDRLLAQLHGTPVVVNVWASWCVPCKAEAPLLRAASRTYGAQIQFLGIDVLDSTGGARSFIASEDMTYPSVFDPSGAIRNSLGMFGQPGTIFYDASGRKVSRWDGQITEQALTRGIRLALG